MVSYYIWEMISEISSDLDAIILIVFIVNCSAYIWLDCSSSSNIITQTIDCVLIITVYEKFDLIQWRIYGMTPNVFIDILYLKIHKS